MKSTECKESNELDKRLLKTEKISTDRFQTKWWEILALDTLRLLPAIGPVSFPIFFSSKKAQNWFQGIKSASLCSLTGRYDNPIPTRFPAPIECIKLQHSFLLWFFSSIKAEPFPTGLKAETVFAFLLSWSCLTISLVFVLQTSPLLYPHLWSATHTLFFMLTKSRSFSIVWLKCTKKTVLFLK